MFKASIIQHESFGQKLSYLNVLFCDCNFWAMEDTSGVRRSDERSASLNCEDKISGQFRFAFSLIRS